MGEIEEGYGNYVTLSNIPAQFTGSFVFQALYGDGQIRLRSSIRPSEPLRPRRQQPILAREGPVPGLEPPSRVGVTAMTGPATMSALDNASETGPQRYTGLPLPPPREVGPLPSRDSGFPPPLQGIVSERTNRAVFVAHIALERADEVVYNPWIGCTGVVREAYQFVASQDPRTSASAPRPAKRGTSLRCRRNKGPLLDWGLWRMFKPMFGWWKMRNPERGWFLGGSRFELWNLKDKTLKRPRPNRRGTPLLLPRQENWWCHMDSGMSGSAWLVSGSAWLVSGQVAHGL